jgi:hypothetical protein
MTGKIAAMGLPALFAQGLFCISAVCLFLLATAGPAHADRVVNANEPIVISDDVTNQTTPVVSATGSSSPGSGGNSNPGNQGSGDPGGGNSNNAGNDQNRSGMGDGTNPGQGGANSNSNNQGTNNPSNRNR